MTELELVVFVILFILGRLNPSHGATEDRCAPKACQQGQPSIRFPYILNNMQDKSCAYPGFELSCNANGNTVINLPSAGEFLVDFIHYRQQNIWLKDPSDCLPLRLRNFNTTGSTLTVAGYREFTFWNCSGNSDRMLPGLTRVECLSGKGYDIMVLPSNELSGTDPKDVEGCEHTWKVQVPSVPKDWSSSRTIETIGLTWEFPRCENCEEQHGTCALKSEKSKEVTCSYPDEETKDTKKHSKWGMIAGMMTPWILLVVVSCYITKKSKARNHPAALTSPSSTERGRRGQLMSPAIIGTDSSSSTLGVDSPTIASYPKIQITENTTKLIEPMGDDTCAICLLEYCPNDTVKIIPECNHHFHDHCIDQWLRKKATCPLCRKQQHRHHPQHDESVA